MRSRAQWRFLFANGMPFAKRWARATPGGKGTRYQKLPIKVSKKAMAVKAPNYGARAGQTIGGRLVRGSDGKFASSGGAAPVTPKRQRKPPKPPTAAAQARATERQAARDAERRTTRDAVLAQLGIDPGASEALVMLANGEQPQPEVLARMGAVEAGLVEQARDGSYRLTPAGRQMLSAAERGDKGAAGDVISRARDKRAAQEATPPKAAGGGGGGKKKPEKPPKLPQRQTSQTTRPVGGGGGGAKPPAEKPAAQAPTTDPALAALAQRLSAGETLTDDEQQTLIRNGLARMVRGELVLTQAGSRAIRTKERLTRFSGETLWDAIVNDNSLDIEEEQELIDRLAPFHVYKDRAGRLRWVAYSSNAYRDRDEEIVSTKALTDDCARADTTKAYGPLRWWHVPGWELGACDFNAMHGRVLVESGTFTSDAIGRAVAAKAAELQLSIGFTHAPDEPDRSGVFHHIQRFERSLVPSGRAANPFTRLSVVKESEMDTEKETAIKALLGDEAATQVIAGAEQVQKDADDRQTAYKSDAAVAAPVATDPWAALGAQLAQTLKDAVASMVAPPAAVEPVAEATKDDGEGDMEVMAEEVAIEEPAAVEEDPGEMTYDEFVQAIRAVVREELSAELKAQIGPLAAGLDIEKKVSSAVQSLMQPYQAQKDDEAAQLRQQLKEAQDRLNELEGDIPAAFRPYSGFRASAAPETILKQAGALPPTGDDESDPFAEIRNKLFGTTNGHA
jgi:hypothetical protein